MKSFLIILFISCSVILSSCNNTDNDSESSRKPVLIQEHNSSFDELGTFYRHSKVDEVGTYHSGPLAITIESAEIVSGSFRDDYDIYGITSSDKINTVILQIGFKLDNVDEDVSFTEENMHLVTDSGEEIQQPHELISSAINIPVINNNDNVRQVGFKIEESDIENMKKVDFIVEAPINDKEEPLGEDLEIELEFN
ncbi:hypothetical protein [Oceanobacillus bengalensis]|uniref:DUF4352 domain-containing protein n=1 Tax=Oceanobacillus bengalensis TaxID=1435466 RepID=A0A494Z0A5_9BACI|nr:hypothetical protein [Oceanobacillus bengalensis]RKQ15883.1 hypothetical protein D8M05_08990 [Oceanobacillus bengalensis]